MIPQPEGGAFNPFIQRHHRLIAKLRFGAADIQRKVKIQLRYAVVGQHRLFGRFVAHALQASRNQIEHRVDQINPANVVAHSDVAPQRKDDPGPLFPWRQLAAQGIGAWPNSDRVAFYLAGRAPYEPVDEAELLTLLDRYGYEVKPELTDAQRKRVITAFQMHFRPARYDGLADAETEAIAQALLEKYGQG